MKPTKLSVRHRGPLVIEGEFELYDSSGALIDVRGAKKLKLCRCGHSKISPICDGAHYRSDFEANTTPTNQSVDE